MTLLWLATPVLWVAWLVALRWLTSASRMQATGDAIQGHLLEIAVYRDVPGQVVACFFRVCRSALVLGLLLLPPALAVAPLFVPALLWLGHGYSQRPFRVGEAGIISAHGLAGNLTAPEGLRVEASVGLPTRGETDWRVRADREGDFTVQVGGVQKRVCVARGPRWMPERDTQNLVVHYPPANYPWGDLDVPWWGVWLAIASLWGGLLSFPFSATIKKCTRVFS